MADPKVTRLPTAATSTTPSGNPGGGGRSNSSLRLRSAPCVPNSAHSRNGVARMMRPFKIAGRRAMMSGSRSIPALGPDGRHCVLDQDIAPTRVGRKHVSGLLPRSLVRERISACRYRSIPYIVSFAGGTIVQVNQSGICATDSARETQPNQDRNGRGERRCAHRTVPPKSCSCRRSAGGHERTS